MTERPSGHEGHQADTGAGHRPGHAGAGPRTYLVVAAFLLAITIMEVWIFYVPALARVLVPILLILSTLKFALVAMFYMHLRFDHAWFSYALRRPAHHRHRPRRRAPVALRPHRHHGRVPGGRGVTGMTAFHWHPEVALGLEAILVGYLLRHRRPAAPLRLGTAALARARHRLRRRHGDPGGRGARAPRRVGRARGALGAHMVQHLLLILVVPLLWLLGLPPWLLAPVARAPVVGRLGWWLTRPLTALALASAVQVAWHVPAAFDAALRVDRFHALEHVTLLAPGSSCGGRSRGRRPSGRGRARPPSSSISSWRRSP